MTHLGIINGIRVNSSWTELHTLVSSSFGSGIGIFPMQVYCILYHPYVYIYRYSNNNTFQTFKIFRPKGKEALVTSGLVREFFSALFFSWSSTFLDSFRRSWDIK